MSVVRHVVATYHIDGFAVEGWQYYGTKRGVKGTAQAAFAVGRVVGALEAAGLERWVEITRPAVLGALGLKRNASKAVARGALKALTTMPEDASEHEWDAAGVAVAGAERFHEIMGMADMTAPGDWLRA
jgi:hypothetical protein